MAGRGSPEAPRDRDFDDGDDEHSPSAAPRPATGSSPPGVSDSSLGIEIRQGSVSGAAPLARPIVRACDRTRRSARVASQLSESDFDSSVIFRRMEVRTSNSSSKISQDFSRHLKISQSSSEHLF